jgi:hypothetical protein
LVFCAARAGGVAEGLAVLASCAQARVLAAVWRFAELRIGRRIVTAFARRPGLGSHTPRRPGIAVGQGITGRCRSRGRLLLWAGRRGGCLQQQHRDVVVELAPGMGAEPVEQLVGGCLQVGVAQRVEAVVQPEVAAGPVACLEQAVGVENKL